MPETVTLPEAIRLAIESAQRDLFTALPGRVDAYFVDEQTANVIPQLKVPIPDEDGNKATETLPTIQRVPVMFPGGGAFSITYPIAQGDPGLIVFSMYNIGQWQEAGQVTDPLDQSLHPLSGAVFIPGLRPTTSPSDQANGAALTVAGSEIRIGSKDATESMVLGDQLKTWLENHNHPTGVGPSGPPAQAGTLPSVLSTKIKVE